MTNTGAGLIDRFSVDCAFIEQTVENDGQGGYVREWLDGAEFPAAIVVDQTMNARTAEKDGVTSVYTVTVDASLPIEWHTVFRRLSDGAVFRVTSHPEEKVTPLEASFAFKQCTAERWVLPS